MKEPYPCCRDNRVVSWVSAEWLEAHLGDAGLILVDCRQNSHAYFQEHIPGAIYLHEGLLRMHIGRIPVRWIPPESAQSLLRTLGFGQDSPIVVYSGSRQNTVSSSGTGDGLEQAFVAYTLARFGCRRVMLLDGGLDRWRSGSRPLSRDYGYSSQSAFTVEVQIDFFIGYDECLRIKDDPDVVLLDTRPSLWYEKAGPWMKPGHIPGAVNLPATCLLDTGNPTLLMPEAAIRSTLCALGITPEKTIICSCGTGRSAAAVFLILKWYLGYPDVVMYEGGFTEWVSYPENMTVTGKMPR